jgi:hypothetical protein
MFCGWLLRRAPACGVGAGPTELRVVFAQLTGHFIGTLATRLHYGGTVGSSRPVLPKEGGGRFLLLSTE